MPSLMEALTEADRRGLLSEQQKALLNRGQQLQEKAPPIPDPVRLESPGPTPEPFPTEPMVMTGAMGGMAAGAGAAPPPLNILTSIAGGALGAGMGYYGQEGLNRAYKALGIIPKETPLPTNKEVLQRAAQEMTLEAAFSGGTMKLAQMARQSKQSIQKFLATNEGRELAIKAKSLGIGLGLVDVTESGLIRGYPKVIGRFPFFATPFRVAKERQADEVLRSRDRLLHRLGPSVGLAEMGVDVNRAAKSAFKEFRDEANRRYEEALALADERGVSIPTTETKKALVEKATELAQRVPRVVGEEGEKAAKTVADNPIKDFVQRFGNLTDEMTVREYDGLLEELDVAITRAKESGFNIKPLMEIKKAAEGDFLNMAGDEEAVRLFREADDFYTRSMKTFESPVAQRFRRVEKRPFRVGLSKPGLLNEDELFSVVWNGKSAQSMKQLKALIGPQAFKRATRTHIETVWDSAIERAGAGKVFNPEAFARDLGLNNPRSPEFASLKEALQGSGVSSDELKTFTDIVRAAFKEGVPDPSTFVARRAVLGGSRSALKALLPFAGGGAAAGGALGGTAGGFGGLSAALLATYLARRGSTILSRPAELKLLNIAADDARPLGTRVVAWQRLIRLASDVFQDKQEPLSQVLPDTPGLTPQEN